MQFIELRKLAMITVDRAVLGFRGPCEATRAFTAAILFSFLLVQIGRISRQRHRMTPRTRQSTRIRRDVDTLN